MLVLRIATGMVAVVLLSAACAAPMPSLPIDPTPMAGSPTPAPPSDQEAAIAELCDPQQAAGLANLAGQLEAVDGTSDTQQLSGALHRAAGNLRMITFGPDGMSTRDSAVGLMGDLAAGIDDQATRSSTAIAAVQNLRALEGQICPPPEM